MFGLDGSRLSLNIYLYLLKYVDQHETNDQFDVPLFFFTNIKIAIVDTKTGPVKSTEDYAQ
jgi:hypothetical protein